MKGGRYGRIRKDTASRVWKGERDGHIRSALSKRGCWLFLVCDEALRLLILDYGEQEGFIAPPQLNSPRGRIFTLENVLPPRRSPQ